MGDKKEVLQEFDAIGHDYKAEVLAAEILANPNLAIDIRFKSISTFRRSISRDVETLQCEEDLQQDKLIFLVNREGLYDMIPQSITHYSPPDIQGEKRSFIEEIKYQREQEAHARKFFVPIEGEFFQQRLKLETLEREFDNRKNAARNRELFETLFGKSDIFEDLQVLTLLYLLPLASRIRGDIHLISYCLSRILNYEVTVEKKWEPNYFTASGDLPGLDRMRLGMNAILTGAIRLTQLQYHVHIVGIEPEHYRHFIKGGKHDKVMSFLISYFFPVNNQLHVHLNLIERQHPWVLSEDEISFLGFNSIL